MGPERSSAKETLSLSSTPAGLLLERLSSCSRRMVSVEIVPRVGTYVTQIDLRSVKNAYEMKKNLEGLAAELAAQRATEEQVRDLLSIAQGFSQLDNVQQYRECIENDKKFHYFTRLASGNPLLIKTLNDLSVITVRFLQYIQYVEEDYQWYKGSIMAIARAIRDRDGPRARSEAEEHTAAFLAKLASYFLWIGRTFFKGGYPMYEIRWHGRGGQGGIYRSPASWDGGIRVRRTALVSFSFLWP